MGVQELAAQYSRAWVDRDLDSVMALHTDETIFHFHGPGSEPATGSAAVREAFEAILGQIPDLRFDSKRAYIGEGHFVSEYEMSGTVDGKRFACDGVDVIAVGDGRVARKDSYTDWAAFARQTGLSASGGDS